MKITNVEVIKFRVTDEYYRKHHRWGYGCPPEDRKVGGDTPLDDLEYTVGAGINGIQTITKISTDEGAEGFAETVDLLKQVLPYGVEITYIVEEAVIQ